MFTVWRSPRHLRRLWRLMVRPLAHRLGRHFLLAQGYLRSADSDQRIYRLSAARLRIKPRLSPRTPPALRRIWRQLGKIGRLAGLHALTPLASQTEIGRGYHTGATLPMARQPSGWQSDRLGRVKGLARVHVVDASVWPDIPSGPVTLTAMSNAHRIASERLRLEDHEGRRHGETAGYLGRRDGAVMAPSRGRLFSTADPRIWTTNICRSIWVRAS